MPKARRTRRTRDPNKPKRGKSAYLMFSQEERPIVVSQHPDMSFAEVAREVAKRWKTVDPERKAKLEAAAKEDRERYMEEMKTYEPPPVIGEDGKRRRRRRGAREGPKRNVSSFMWFCKQNRAKVKEENPTAIMTGISSILGKQWNAMDSEARAPFEKLARADKERYVRELQAYQETKAKAMASLDMGGGDEAGSDHEEDADASIDEMATAGAGHGAGHGVGSTDLDNGDFPTVDDLHNDGFDVDVARYDVVW